MSDRHSKWVRVEPGTVIPAGQPYRVEYAKPLEDHPAQERERLVACEAREFLNGSAVARPLRDDLCVTTDWFVDSSWKPPLDLPTEPTWGIVVHKDYGNYMTGRWERRESFLVVPRYWSVPIDNVGDFIRFTDEQVARIEAAR